MTDVLLALRNVTVRSRGEIVFDALNFSMQKGGQWAVVGENGEAKTAFLDAIAGRLIVSKGEMAMPFLLEHSSAGEAQNIPPYGFWLVAQVSAQQHFQRLSNANYYYQQRFNSFDMEESETVAGYIERFVANNTEGYWTKENVVEQLHLAPLLEERVIMLSSGETKRLLIAAALLKNPLFLLLDHPLIGLDAQTRKEFDSILTRIVRSGIHVIIATSSYEIPSVITHVAVLEDRAISRCFPVNELSLQVLSHSNKNRFDPAELQSLLQEEDKSLYQIIVEMKNVVVRYGDKTILNGINWKVESGERWALLGHNGAGKSTLLSLINGDNPQAFANKIVLFDRPKGSGESIWDIKRNIGFVSPELIACFPADNTCLHVIESGFYDTLGLFRISDPAKVALAEKWLRALGIATVANKIFRTVSTSDQRLCLLVRALVKKPALLILDEPFQGLDDGLKEGLKALIEEICSHTNVTLVYVSHYQNEIPGCVDRVLVLQNGEVMEQGLL